MIRFLCIVILFSWFQMAWSQSDFIEKGHNGLEINIGQIFVEGKNPFLAYLGGSLNGKLDLGVGLANTAEVKLYSFGGAYHIGGEKKDLGIALDAAYVVYPNVKNYFLFGSTFYTRSNLGNIILVPNFNVEIATMSELNFITSVGLSIFTNGNAGLVVRPQFVFAPEQTYFSIALGLLAQS